MTRTRLGRADRAATGRAERATRRAARRATGIALALSAMVVGVAQARAQGDTFTPAQRQEIVSVVRQALKRDPSILKDAIAALRADEQNEEAQAAQQAVSANRGALAQDGDAVAGNPRGDVTLVEFYDPRCGYCKRMAPTIDAAIARDPKLRVVYRLIPILGPASVTEAAAIEAAGLQGAYLPMKTALMAEAAPADLDRIRAIATSLKLDANRLAGDMQGPAVRKAIGANLALARSLHVDGTPALVVGGQMVQGAVPQDELAQAIATARG